MTRPRPSDRCARASPGRGVRKRPSVGTARRVGVGLYRAGFYIRSIVAHHVTSFEPSRSSGDDADASRSHPTGAPLVP